MKNQCFCGCGSRRNPKRRFAPGHNQFRREQVERMPYRGKRKPPAVKIYDNKRPLSLGKETT